MHRSDLASDLAVPTRTTPQRHRSPSARPMPDGERRAVRVVVRPDLGPFSEAWDTLVAQSPLPTPFLRSWWLEAWRHPRPRFVLVIEDGELIGGMALQEDRVFGVPCYRVLGHSWLAPDHLDALVAPGRQAQVEPALARWARRPGARFFDLEGVAEDNVVVRILPSASAVPATLARYRRLDGERDGSAPQPSGRARTASQRGRRQLAKLGGEHRVVRGPAVTGALERFRDLHERRWRDGSGFLVLYDRFEAAARAGAEAGEVVVHEIVVDGTVHASLVEFWLAGRAFFYQHGHDPDAPFRSPGTVAMSFALEHAARSGAREYDLLRGTEGYKTDWAEGERALLHVRAANGAVGRVAMSGLRARRWLGERKGRLRRRGRAIAAKGSDVARSRLPRARAAGERIARWGARGRTSAVITEAAELERLRGDWGSLRADPPTPNTQLDHVIATASTLHHDEEPCVVVVHDDGQLTGAAPLARQRSFPHRIRLLDHGAAGGFLAADEQQLERLVKAVLRLGHPMHLDALVAGAPTERTVRTLTSRWFVRSGERRGGPSLPIDPSWTEPMGKLSSSRRRADLRRATRRAEELGEVTYESEAPGEDVENALDELVRVEALSWKSEAGTALAQDHARREALRRYLTAPDVRDSVIVTRIRIAGQTVAIDINVVIGDRLWGLKGGVDDSFRRCAPGLLLKAFTIGVAAQEGLARYEFMGETSHWKQMWGAGPIALHRVNLYPPTLRGAAALTGDLVRKVRAGLRERRQGGSSEDANGEQRRPRPQRSDGEAARLALRHPGTHVPAGPDRSVQVITRPDDLASLRQEWQGLQADVPGTSSHLDWILAFARGLPARDRLCVITTYEGDRLTGVAPLVRRGWPARRLELVILGASGFLYRDAEQAARLVDAVVGLPLPLRLDLLPTGSMTERAVADHPKRWRFVRASARDGAGSMLLDERHVDDPLAVLDRNRRKDLRRRRRRAEEVGELRFETIEPGDDLELLRRLFDDLVRIEARGWKGRAGTALASDDRRREMDWRYVSAPEVRRQVRFSTLHLGDDLVAVDLAVVTHDRWWCDKCGYDEAFARFSPGHLLTAYTVQRAAQEGFSTFELGGDSEPYKEDWARPRPLTSVRLYPPTGAGLLAGAADAVAKGRRDVARMTRRIHGLRVAAVRWIDAHRRPSAPEGRVAVVEDPADLEALRGEWKRLRTWVPGPSSHLDHVRATGLNLRDGAELRVVTVRDTSGALAGVAPLIRVAGRPPRLHLATTEATEFLYTGRPQLEQLVDAVLGLGEPLTFETLLAESPTDVVLQDRARRVGLTLTTTRPAGPSLPLDDDLAEPLDRLSAGRRSDLRRKLRRAQQMGEVEFEVHAAGEDLPARFAEFLRIEAAGWKGRAGTALAEDDEQRERLWHYLSAPAVRGDVWVARMLIDGTVVAIDLVVIAERRYWFLKGSYDERYGACSPGMLLKVHTVGWAARRGLERFEFMGATEPYKEAWGAPAQTLRVLRFYPRSFVGLAAFSRDATSKVRRVAARGVLRIAGR